MKVKELSVPGWLCSSKSWEGGLGQDGAVSEAGRRQRKQQFPLEEKGGGVKKQEWQTAVPCPLIMGACGFQVGSLQTPHLLQAFCFTLHHLQLQMATVIPRLGMLLDLAKFLKLSLLRFFFLFFPPFFLPQEIHLECIGHGPVVCVSPREMNFGSLPVLQDSAKNLSISNHSDIPATFWAEMVSACGAVSQGRVLVSSSP